MARLLCEQLSAAGVDVAVVADESQSPARTQPFSKLVLSEDKLTGLGFSGLPENWGWLCGDLCYAVAVRERSGFRKYVLIESDVFVPQQSSRQVVNALIAHPADAIAAHLGPSDRRRIYSQGLADFGLDPTWGCIFPITAVTPQAIQVMTELRKEQLSAVPRAQLNDEAILAGSVLRGGLSHERLENVLPEYIDPACFDTNPPHLLEAVRTNTQEHRIFHPVVPFELVKQRIASGEKTYSRHRLRNILATAPEPMKGEIEGLLKARRNVSLDQNPDHQRMNELMRVLAPDGPIRILDVGANPLIEGEVSYQRLLDQGYAHVIGFEPMEDAYAALQERKSARETYLPLALGDGSMQTLLFCKSPGFSSVFAADEDSARLLGFAGGMRETGRSTLKTERLDDISEVAQIDFLKIDVQGSETAIISNGRSKLKNALVVQTEVRFFSIYEGEPSFGDLESELNSQGFRFLKFTSLKHVPLSRRRSHKRLKRSEFSQSVDGDAFFVRDLRQIGKWEDDAVKRLAILADSVMDCPDLVVFALETLEVRGRISAEVIDRYIDKLPAGRRRDG